MQEWIYYDSKTGNVDRFVHKLAEATGWHITKIDEHTKAMHPGHLITFTTGFGQVPPKTDAFMSNNADYVQTVSVSGNRNWGANFGKAGDTLADRYCLPLLMKFELSGNGREVQEMINKINEYHHDYETMDIAQ
ncbi:class Ib ribonucleoside-diphosphate reductase assembly flavoprotein NrdI [Olivibacter sitiensis]|uniref:class Ib ribonucleoside-diphosphate reductase assembly flavoprotein NrdI n=1 Tax=Olivibacter sitiensis TaxID=376470 RepID=UPI0004242A47|nr:class Ib ribonucleoside-diphosphate reductase assembly flavoprotein NrdI [Olivibacter sitiensis]